ncbi:hypothetical protein JHW33_00335 [Rahnella aceris]|nr:hypothetical protein JHW33_00335 [Rahnella aceris]
MQFKKIKRGMTENGNFLRADLYPLQARQSCYCQHCLNPLQFRITHAEGRFFEHDLELSDVNQLEVCAYRLSSLPPPPINASLSSVWTAVNGGQHEGSDLGNPRPQRFLCVMCNYEYDGLKTCPRCHNNLYTTEVRNRNTLTLSLKFAQ